MNMALDRAIQAGFVPLITPTLVRPEIMRGTGLPRRARRRGLPPRGARTCTSPARREVALAGYHADEILDLSNGPLSTPAGRPATARRRARAGKDNRGIIRVHQFNKLETFVYALPEDAEAEHERLLAYQEELLQACELSLPRDRHGRGRPRLERRPQVRRRGLGADAGHLPRAHVDEQLHHVPGAPARHPLPHRERQDRAGRDAQRHARDDPLDGRDPRDAPAGRRLGRRARGAAAVPGRARSAGAGR